MFDIIDKTKHKLDIINTANNLLLETITYNSTPYQNCIFQNKIYYLVLTKIAILNNEHHTYHSSLFNREKNNLSPYIPENISTYYTLKDNTTKETQLPYNENCNYRI